MMDEAEVVALRATLLNLRGWATAFEIRQRIEVLNHVLNLPIDQDLDGWPTEPLGRIT